MEKRVWEFTRIFLIVSTTLLWSMVVFAFVASITLTTLKLKDIILIEWEQIVSLTAFLLILDPTLLIIDAFRRSMDTNYVGGGENVER